MKKNNKGFSILEVIIASSIFLVILGVAGSYFIDFLKVAKKTENKLASDIQKDMATKYLWKDLQSATLTFNNYLSTKSPEHSFFQYRPGCPKTSVDENTYARIFKLNNTNRTFTFLITTKVDDIPFVYSPEDAYNIGESDDPAIAGSLEFISLNKGNKIKNKNPELWKDKNLIAVLSPVWIRDWSSPCSGSFPRQPIYFGVVEGNNFNKAPSAFMLNQANPETLSAYSSIDQYLRKLPALGGSAPVTILKNLEIVTYQFKQRDPNYKNLNTVTRIVKNGLGEKKSEFVVIENVQEVIFKRKNIVDQLIEVEVKLNRSR